MSDERLALGDRCLADTGAYLARHAEGGGGTEEIDGVRLFAGGHPYPGPFCNGVVRLDPATGMDTLLERSREFFAPRRRGYIVWARDDDTDIIEHCRAAGWHERPPVEGMPIIFLDRPLPPRESDHQVRRVSTEADAETYLRVLAESYGMQDAPAAILHAVFCSPAAVLGEGAAAVLIDIDGATAACGLSVTLGDLACVMWTATSPWARGRGLGPVCLTATTNACFEAGARYIYGQSSQMGVPQWRKLGYDVIGSYHRFLAPPAR
jgi:hypothetical protein